MSPHSSQPDSAADGRFGRFNRPIVSTDFQGFPSPDIVSPFAVGPGTAPLPFVKLWPKSLLFRASRQATLSLLVHLGHSDLKLKSQAYPNRQTNSGTAEDRSSVLTTFCLIRFNGAQLTERSLLRFRTFGQRFASPLGNNLVSTAYLFEHGNSPFLRFFPLRHTYYSRSVRFPPV